ncbi:MAG: phage portal protein, partial [Oscillospiraceae bacterium]|nr:phage portal protein [Oscillospiraceae bacterium]
MCIRDRSLDSAAGWKGWTAQDAVALSRDRAMKLSTVSRCVELRSNAIAMLPVYLMDENTKKRLTDHPLGPLLWGPPNEMMTRLDYERLMQCNLDLCGNAYAWINRDGRTGRPVELIPLCPGSVTPYITPDGALVYIYTNPRTGEMTRLAPEDVLHYKAYSTDGITGISILRRASLAVSAGLDAQQYQADLYANGGQPSGVLMADTDIGGTVTVTNAAGQEETITKTERIRREWEKIHSGPGKNFRIAVLPRGVTYTQTAMKNSEAQFVESEEYRVADVARFFGVPLYLLNAGKQAYSSNEQNSIDFVKHTMLPIIVQREQEDTWKLLLPRERAEGLRIKREPKQLLRGDTAAQIAWYKG